MMRRSIFRFEAPMKSLENRVALVTGSDQWYWPGDGAASAMAVPKW